MSGKAGQTGLHHVRFVEFDKTSRALAHVPEPVIAITGFGEKMSKFAVIKGGVTAAKGFSASGVKAGIKYSRPDMALIASDRDAAVAATFTTNKIQGAHVKLCRKLVKSGSKQAIIINAGNANACNGPSGIIDAKRMGVCTGKALGIPASKVLMCSTGTIGIKMPMDKIESGIRLAVTALVKNGGDAAARAIMTTDTVDKQYALQFKIDGKIVRIGGMAKGAGMIEPNMATMLCFITTDAAVKKPALQKCLSAAIKQSFNRVTVDGDQSCNDTVLLLANGADGNKPLDEKHKSWKTFCEAVDTVTRELAMKIVRDGEGATKCVTIKVNGAASDADAGLAARAIANSLLVKTSWFGCDPNWGRVIDAVGYSGAKVVEEKVKISYNNLHAVKGGRRDSKVPLKALEKILREKEFVITIDLGLGKGSDTVYTCDCSEEYVKINSEYMT
mgnify:CR=1 FL=1